MASGPPAPATSCAPSASQLQGEHGDIVAGLVLEQAAEDGGDDLVDVVGGGGHDLEEAVERAVERLAPALDEPVGVEQQEIAGGEALGRFGVHLTADGP